MTWHKISKHRDPKSTWWTIFIWRWVNWLMSQSDFFKNPS